MGNEHDGQDTKSTDEQSELSSGINTVAAIHAEAREPSASDRAYSSCGVDDDERILGLIEIEAIVVVEKHGEIEEIEPPDGVGKALADTEGPKATVTSPAVSRW